MGTPERLVDELMATGRSERCTRVIVSHIDAKTQRQMTAGELEIGLQLAERVWDAPGSVWVAC
ncbi:MAG: hypothetical protein WAS21_30440 [Geminicoccaceae bacterium]